MAPNGTVFLDEVGEMSPRMQVVLLRFLETGEIQRVGADRSHTRVNVRLITATNRDLHTQIAAGSFREDLYFRLNVIRLCIPPLRERVEDIPVLVEFFRDSYSRQYRVDRSQIAPAAQDVLMAHRWPGNVRELKNVIERIVIKAEGRTILPADLPSDVLRGASRTTLVVGEVISNGATGRSTAEELGARMLQHGESFWMTVYPLFMSRDLTRADVRKIVQIGLENTSGNYRLLTRLFGMPDSDYKRFLSFLRKHECHLPFQHFRVARVSPTSPAGDAKIA
jgi:DNA-binding NtrC family response regulator